jgi:phospholipid N-methyltransferase
MEKLKFIKEFLKNWRVVGSVTPSSRFLMNKMIVPVNFERAKIIVELGPGLGGLTKKLLTRMNQESKLLVFEINPDFCRELEKINDARLQIFNTSALGLTDYLKGEKVDYVLSGLPLTNFDDEARSTLLQTVKNVLRPAAIYIQFQYSLGAYKELQSIFNRVSIKFTLLNIPPAFVYQCYD